MSLAFIFFYLWLGVGVFVNWCFYVEAKALGLDVFDELLGEIDSLDRSSGTSTSRMMRAVLLTVVFFVCVLVWPYFLGGRHDH